VFFGRQPMALIALNSICGFTGLWALASVIRRLGFPRTAAGVIVVVSLYPSLIGYEHFVLSETPVFAFLMLLLLTHVALFQRRTAGLKTLLCCVLLTIGYYLKPNLLYLIPAIAALRFLEIVNSRFADTRWLAHFSRRPAVHAAAHAALIVLLPWFAVQPWQHQLSASERMNRVYSVGLLKQAVVEPDDAILGESAGRYADAIERATVDGSLLLSGITNQEGDAIARLSQHSTGWGKLLIDSVTHNTKRYLGGVFRTMLYLSGFPSRESENADNERWILQPPSRAKISSRVRPWDHTIFPYFDSPASRSLLGNFVYSLRHVYAFMIMIGSLIALVAFVMACIRRHARMMAFFGLPWLLIGMHAVMLLSIDRYAFPVYPVLLAGIFVLPAWLFSLLGAKQNDAVSCGASAEVPTAL
jgi:hypothetical protein